MSVLQILALENPRSLYSQLLYAKSCRTGFLCLNHKDVVFGRPSVILILPFKLTRMGVECHLPYSFPLWWIGYYRFVDCVWFLPSTKEALEKRLRGGLEVSETEESILITPQWSFTRKSLDAGDVGCWHETLGRHRTHSYKCSCIPTYWCNPISYEPNQWVQLPCLSRN